MAGTSSWWNPGFAHGLTPPPNKIACPRCTLLNDRFSPICAACLETLTHADMRTDANVIYISSDDDDDDNDGFHANMKIVNHDGIVCQTCTHLNKVGTSACAACGTAFIANNKECVVAFTGPSSSFVYKNSTGMKFHCGNCTFLNNRSATICACCGSGLEFKKLRVEDQTGVDAFQSQPDLHVERLIMCAACKGQFGSRSRGHELANCNHGFCRPCLSTAVVNNLLELIKVEGTDQLLNKYNCALCCPAEGCHCVLSQRDLRLVVGPSTQGMLDEWLMESITNEVVCPLVRCCPKCKDSERQLLVPPDQFHLLKQKSLRKVLACNGLALPPGSYATKPLLPQHLKNAAPFSSVCSICFCLVCQSCGAAPLSGMVHQCDSSRRLCSDITRAIMKLCFAYLQATRASASDGRREKKKIRVNFGYSLRVGKSSQLMPSQDGDGLISNMLFKWFSVKDFEDMAKVQGAAALEQAIYDIGNSQREEVSLVDTLAQAALEELTSIILQVKNDNNDILPPLVAALLCSHDLPHTLLKWLVSNDSVMDITARCDLYWAVLGFLRALSSSWDLLPLLCSHGAEHDCFATLQRWQIPGSLMSDFENLYKQAQFMLRRGDHLHLFDNPKGKGDSEDPKKEQLEYYGFRSSSLLIDIVSTYELLRQKIMEWEGQTLQHPWSASPERVYVSKASRSVTKGQHRKGQLLYSHLQNLASIFSSSGTSLSRVRTRSMQADAELDCFELGEQPRAIEDAQEKVSKRDACTSQLLVEAYKKALKPLQFDEACLLPTHYFRSEVKKSEAMMLNKRRARAIGEEMTQLNTILPLEWESSIFLRVDEQRADVLRALIIGPEGTPYENGVFLFDLLLEHSYPDTPPKVQFLTTGGGDVRFNPNLYENGKVCLSLLGTWEGPGWQAGQSSIMQVLISIQGLILVADPFFNEPGTLNIGMRDMADAYLHDQRRNTVQYSMLPALQCPDPLFLPVIRTHFRLKSHHILHQCTTWMQEDRCATNQYKLSIEELRCELDTLTHLP